MGNTAGETPKAPARAVHPHACGEYVDRQQRIVGQGGSPPRLWGIHAGCMGRAALPRFTPTPVGNTCVMLSVKLVGAVHPHACGEYGRADSSLAGPTGSPPRLWGIRQPFPGHVQRGRFTPTPVGNTPPAAHPTPLCPVHPHACGEYVTRRLRRSITSGSPPRLWGIRCRPSGTSRNLRFTPTPVGNTSS